MYQTRRKIRFSKNVHYAKQSEGADPPQTREHIQAKTVK